MKLNLGVAEVTYGFSQDAITTGDVAEFLEYRHTFPNGRQEHYGVMQHFVDLHLADIAGHLENSFAGALENLMMGAPSNVNVFGTAEGQIEQMFREYIDQEEITQTGAKGVPTQAALKGMNHRLKGKRGPRRPSFLDTGLYEDSFRAWVEK